MFQIAVMPSQNSETNVLIAKTEEWIKFLTHMRLEKKISIVKIIEPKLDMRSPVNKVRVTRAQKNMILEAAGISY